MTMTLHIELFPDKINAKFNCKELIFKNSLLAFLRGLQSCFDFCSMLQIQTFHAFEILYGHVTYLSIFLNQFMEEFITLHIIMCYEPLVHVLNL